MSVLRQSNGFHDRLRELRTAQIAPKSKTTPLSLPDGTVRSIEPVQDESAQQMAERLAKGNRDLLYKNPDQRRHEEFMAGLQDVCTRLTALNQTLVDATDELRKLRDELITEEDQ